MPIDRSIDATIRNLEGLAAHFAAQVREAALRGPLSPESQLQKEALMTARVLLSKLKLVRSICHPDQDQQLGPTTPH
jgi:hypothetical protein